MEHISKTISRKHIGSAPTYERKPYGKETLRKSVYDCPICHGEEVIFIEETRRTQRCICSEIRNNLVKLYNSGAVGKKIDTFTFDNFKAEEPWQKHIADTAKNFLDDPEAVFFFIGGQMGCGKTHICTALFVEMLKIGINGLRMAWRSNAQKLKAKANEADYLESIRPYKEIELLYIDDFFKTQRGAKPTPADVNLAFELIDYRYNNSMLTIISSERLLSEIIELDEGTGSRIVELSKKHCINIDYDINKNQRLK